MRRGWVVRWFAGWGLDRLRKGKFQYYLARFVRHLQASRKQVRLLVLFLQQLADHGASHPPRVIGVAQLLALRVGNQLVAYSGVEEITGHGTVPLCGPYYAIADDSWSN